MVMMRSLWSCGVLALLLLAPVAQAAHHEGQAATGMQGKGMMHGGMGKGMMGMMGGGDADITKEAFLKHAEERFGRMDANGDGTIDASDRKKMHERMQGCMEMMGGMRMMGGMGMMGDMKDAQ